MYDIAKFTLRVAALLCAATLSTQALAQPTALPLWEVGAFAGLASTPAYPGSSDRASRALVLPVFIYRGEVFRADRGSVGARLFRTDDVELDVGFSASLPASSDDVAVRKGMPDLGTLLEFGPRLKMTLARPAPGSRLRFELPVRAVLEFNNGVRGQGFAVEPELGYDVRDVGAGWSLSATGSVVLGDSELNRYFYGVSAPYATASRPVYEAQSGLITTRLGLSTSKSITPDLRVFGFVRYDLLEGAANKASPLFQQTNGTSAGFGLVWIFGRSEQKASAP